MSRRFMHLTVATIAATVLAGAPGDAEASPPTFRLVASASGTQVFSHSEGGLFDPQILTTSSQVLLDGLGTSTALAGAPYPGDFVTTLHGSSGGAAPNYPMYRTSRYPAEPADHAALGPVRLDVTSRARESTAEAVIASGTDGFPTDATFATAKTGTDGTVTATSRATYTGLVVGPLRLGTLVSQAQAVTRDGHVQFSSTLTLTGASVAGTAVTVDESGIGAAGTRVPLPATDDVTGVLAAAGVRITVLHAHQTATSVLAPGLRISIDGTLPNYGATNTELALGRAFVSAEYTTGPTFPEVPTTSPALPPTALVTAPPESPERTPSDVRPPLGAGPAPDPALAAGQPVQSATVATQPTGPWSLVLLVTTGLCGLAMAAIARMPGLLKGARR